MDAESLQKSERRRGRCLDVFLVVSVVSLFAIVTALAVGGVICVMELRSKLDVVPQPAQSKPTFEASSQTGESSYKMQNFVYLQAKSSEVKNRTMLLRLIHHGEGTSMGNQYTFNEEQSSLMPKKEGTYFMYIQLNFTCTSICKKGVLTVTFGDKLTCEVKLPHKEDSTVETKKCWTVSQVEGQRLNSQMTIKEGKLENWSLDLNTSGVGMFLVDS